MSRPKAWGQSPWKQGVLTCAEAQVTFQEFVQVVIQEPLGPEPLGLVVLCRVIRNAPIIVGHHSASGNTVSLELVVLGGRVRDACLGNTRPIER